MALEFSEIFLGHFLGLPRSASTTVTAVEGIEMSGHGGAVQVPLILIRACVGRNQTTKQNQK